MNDATAWALLAVAVAAVLAATALGAPALVRREDPAALGYGLFAFSVAAVAWLVAVAVGARQTSYFQFGVGSGFAVAGVAVRTVPQYCAVVGYQARGALWQ